MSVWRVFQAHLCTCSHSTTPALFPVEANTECSSCPGTDTALLFYFLTRHIAGSNTVLQFRRDSGPEHTFPFMVTIMKECTVDVGITSDMSLASYVPTTLHFCGKTCDLEDESRGMSSRFALRFPCCRLEDAGPGCDHLNSCASPEHIRLRQWQSQAKAVQRKTRLGLQSDLLAASPPKHVEITQSASLDKFSSEPHWALRNLHPQEAP